MNPPLHEWEKAAPLVMDKLETMTKSIDGLTAKVEHKCQCIEDKIDRNLETVHGEMDSRFHVAPCTEVTRVTAAVAGIRWIIGFVFLLIASIITYLLTEGGG